MVLNGEAPVFQTAQPHASRPTTAVAKLLPTMKWAVVCRRADPLLMMRRTAVLTARCPSARLT